MRTMGQTYAQLISPYCTTVSGKEKELGDEPKS